MRILAVKNTRGTDLGAVGMALQEAGAEVVHCEAYAGDPLPETHDAFHGLVVMGGEQNALDDELHPYLPRLSALMRDFAEADKAVLGICLGSQLLARGFGAQNHIGTAPEFGWQAIELTPDAESDPMLSAVESGFPIFEWHSDTFTLPDGAVRLATNGNVANQAFRVGRAAYGTQFHFEANQKVVEDWNRNFEATIRQRVPDWFDTFEDRRARHGALADEAGLALARRWVELVRVD